MTTFRFLHTADLHLGSPFKGLAVKDRLVAKRFAQAIRTAFTTLVDRALEEGVAFVVIAGDVYDGEWPDNTIGLFFNREIARLDRAGIPTFLLRGNHDAASVVTRSIALPDSVNDFGTDEPRTFRLDGLGVALHGQGFAARVAPDNLATRYPAPVPGWFNIGVLHTSLTGSAEHETYAPCSLGDLSSRGYDYWALGHVHEFAVVSATGPTVVYPGNLQGRSVREPGPKGAVLVTVEDGRVARLERLIVDEARWASLSVDISDCDTSDDLFRAVQHAVEDVADGLDDRLLALRVTLTGRSRLGPWLAANRVQSEDEVQAACQRVHGDVWLEALKITISAPASTVAADPGFDLAAALREVASDPAVLAKATDTMSEIANRLPGGRATGDLPLGDDAATLLSEACELLVARARG